MSMIAAGVYQYNTSEAYLSVSAALKVGFAHIDTALDYENQQGVGRAIKDSGLPRDQIFVETKVPGCGMDKTTRNPFMCYNSTKQNLESDLELLGLPYVDLVILHFPPLPSFIMRSCNELGSCEMARQQWKAMEEFYKAGKAKAIGVSNYCPSCFECLAKADIFPMVNQVMFHVGMGADPTGLISYSKKLGVVTQAYSVLGNTPWTGHADDKILHGNLTTTIAKAHNRSSVEVALKWVVNHGVPAVTKSMNPAHLKSDLDLWSWELTSGEMAELDAYHSNTPFNNPSFACSKMSSASVFV
jgi:diketogulonate reductase-like aldo/keto reductase